MVERYSKSIRYLDTGGVALNNHSCEVIKNQLQNSNIYSLTLSNCELNTF